MKNVLSKEGIKRYLVSPLDVEVYDSVTSTNDLAKDMAKSGAKDVLLVAREQTKGRGRYARKFYSPKDAGVYFSLIIEPTCKEEMDYITPMCAVAAADAIRAVCEKNALIKWVNDIYIEQKKCVGILCEGVSSHGAEIDRAVCGIGVNIRPKDGGVDEEIKDVAGFVGEKDDVSNLLVATICDNLMRLHERFDENYISSRYKEMSMLIGKRVEVSKFDEGKPAVVRNIDEKCRLVVVYDDGSVETLVVGDVRIKI